MFYRLQVYVVSGWYDLLTYQPHAYAIAAQSHLEYMRGVVCRVMAMEAR